MSHMANIDTIAKESENFESFKQTIFEEYKTIERTSKGNESQTEEWLQEIYDNSKQDLNG